MYIVDFFKEPCDVYKIMIKPFKVNISDETLEDIYSKVKKYPWHEMPDDGGWQYGSNLDYMKEKIKIKYCFVVMVDLRQRANIYQLNY